MKFNNVGVCEHTYVYLSAVECKFSRGVRNQGRRQGEGRWYFPAVYKMAEV